MDRREKDRYALGSCAFSFKALSTFSRPPCYCQYWKYLLRYLSSLPESFMELGAGENDLAELPENLPAQLRALDVHGNQLTRLLALLTVGMEAPDVRRNYLTYLPESLPLSLKALLVEGNSITYLPEMITTLPQACSVHLGNIYSLPHSVLERLQAKIFLPDYAGPRFYLSRAITVATTSRSIDAAVALWYPFAEQAAVRQAWHTFEKVTGVTDFARFLDKLRDSIQFSQSEFRAEVSTWLDQLMIDD